MLTHFSFEKVQKGRWKRFNRTGVNSGDMEDRYHIIAISYFSTMLILEDVHGRVSENFFEGEFKFSVSRRHVSIIFDDSEAGELGKGRVRFGYRFLREPETEVMEKLLRDLEGVANQYMIQSQSPIDR